MKFRNDINGLRAYAVLAVVIFHFLPNALPGGFAGVDVFFVISGYLMTAIIFNGMNKGNFSLISFYYSRAKRILPALACLCLVVAIIGWFLLTPNDYKLLGKHIAGSVTFLSNIMYLRESGYFDAASHEKWLLHTWSLSIEFQFYVLYPLLLIGLSKILSKENLKYAVLIGAIISFAASEYLMYTNPNAAFYVIPSRAWELLVGGLVFLYPLSSKNKSAPLIEYTGLILIIMSFIFITGSFKWPGHFALIPVLGSALILLANSQNSIFTNNKVAQWMGKTSYSVYLWHWPLVVLINYYNQQNNIPVIIGAIILSFILGEISYRYIENIIRFNKPQKFNYDILNYIVSIPLLLVLLTGTLGSYLFLSGGAKQRLGDNYTEITKLMVMPNRDNGYCFNNFSSSKIKLTHDFEECTIGDKSSPITGLLIGDSFAGHYEPAFDEVLSNLKISMAAITTNWCYPSIYDNFIGSKTHKSYQQCLLNREFIKENINKYEFIILSGHWYKMQEQQQLNDFFKTVDFFANSNNNLKIIILASPVIYQSNIANHFKSSLLTSKHFNPEHYIGEKNNIIKQINNQLAEFSKKSENIVFINQNILFNKQLSYEKNNQLIPYSLDGKHISIGGSLKVGHNLIENETLKNLLK